MNITGLHLRQSAAFVMHRQPCGCRITYNGECVDAFAVHNEGRYRIREGVRPVQMRFFGMAGRKTEKIFANYIKPIDIIGKRR